MLGGPDNLKATFIGHFHHIEGMTFDGGHVDLRREAFHIDGEMKFHRFGMSSVICDVFNQQLPGKRWPWVGRGQINVGVVTVFLPG